MLGTALPFTISDLEGNELLAKETPIDEQLIEKIASRGRQLEQMRESLLRYDHFRSDLESFLCTGPYEFIFGGADGINALLEKIGDVPTPVSILQILAEFREFDFYSYRHSLVVFALTSLLMEKIYQLRQTAKNMLLVGPIHDFGKRFIPKNILHKTTPLTKHERVLLEYHPIAGYVLLSYYLGDHTHPAAQVALNHHERRDGSGYPRGITNLELLVEMVATCDVYDALVSSRPYRPINYDNRTALEELTRIAEAGRLDWQCVQTLIGQNRTGHPSPEKVAVSLEKRGTPPPNNCYAQIADDV
jgi:HD-GYP domain-containing protein (c-di-GMP phosphodiesterase class II)